jgi:hypothetical protein
MSVTKDTVTFKYTGSQWHQRLIPIVLATQEMEIRGIDV